MRYSIIFILYFAFFSYKHTYSQIKIKGFIINTAHKPLANVSIILLNNKLLPLAYSFSNSDGSFILIAKNIIELDSIRVKFSLLGYEKIITTIPFSKQATISVSLKEKLDTLPEVIVKNSSIYTKGDTTNYLVKSFTNKEDIVIADVLKRIPGIEVLENGQITYQGKSINKFYVEGMDLLDDKYGLANNNLPANSVEQIQILDNHQPIKMLDGAVNTNKAAINLKLNKNARKKIIGKASVGVGGLPFLTDIELIPMKFGFKSQTIISNKYNNIGKEYRAELLKHNAAGNYNDIIGQTSRSDFISLNSPALPQIGKQRFLFNREYSFSINHLLRIKNSSDVILNVDYINDIQTQNSALSSTLYFNTDTIKIVEKLSNVINERLLRGSLQVLSNTKKRYFKNVLKIETSLQKGNSDLASKDTLNQQLESPFVSFVNDLQLLKSFKKTIFGFNFYGSFSNLNSSLNITPGLYPNILNDNNPYKKLLQEFSLVSFFTNISLNAVTKKGFYTIENTLGVHYLKNNFITQLLKEINNANKLINDSFYNDLLTTQIQFSSQNSLSTSLNKFKLKASIPFNYLIIRREGKSIPINRGNIENNIFINPNLQVEFKTSSSITLSMDASLRNNFYPPFTSYSGYYLSNYRSITSSNNILRKATTTQVEFAINQRDVVKALYTSLRISYSKGIDNSIYDQSFYNNLFIGNLVNLNNETKSLKFLGALGKYIYKIKSSINFSFQYDYKSAQQLRDGKLQFVKNNFFTTKYTFNSKLGFLTIDYGGEVQNITWVLKDNFSNRNSLLTQNLALTFSNASNLFIKVKQHYNAIQTNNQKSRNYFFTDISLRKKIVSKKLDIEIIWSNIFNNKKFSTLEIFGNTQINSDYQIRPSYMMAKIMFLL